MEVKATLEEKISKEGNPYKCIEIHLTDTYKKRVFLEQAELELLKMASNNNTEEDSDQSFWK